MPAMARAIPSALAPVVELLELEQPITVTAQQLREFVESSGVDTPAHVVVQRLAERGWLLRTGVRGVWEFAPAAHAGPYPHGDPLLTLRATLQLHPELPVAVALSSALWQLDISARRPEVLEIAVPSGTRVPTALRRAYRVVRHTPRLPLRIVADLPVHSPPSVLVHLAQRPTDVRNWADVLDHLSDLVVASGPDEVEIELRDRPHSTAVRLAYLLSGVAPDLVERLGVEPRGKVWFGPRGRLRRHSARWNLADTVLPYAPSELGGDQ